MSTPTKPKSGGVNLFLAREDVTLLRRLIYVSVYNGWNYVKVPRDKLPPEIISQSKESSNDS